MTPANAEMLAAYHRQYPHLLWTLTSQYPEGANLMVVADCFMPEAPSARRFFKRTFGYLKPDPRSRARVAKQMTEFSRHCCDVLGLPHTKATTTAVFRTYVLACR